MGFKIDSCRIVFIDIVAMRQNRIKMEEKYYTRELKRKISQYCLFGECPSCSRIINGKGIHDVEIYQVYEHTEEDKCDTCNGSGEEEVTCSHCDGVGTTQEKCEDCDGKGRIPDEFGDKTPIREEFKLVKNMG